MLTAPGSTSSQSKRTLAPAPGVTPPPTDGSSYRFLSDVIIARGLVEPAAMKAALQASLAGRSLTEILVDNGELSEEDLARTLAEHHRLDFVDLDVFAVDPQASALIEPDVARRFGAVPIAVLPSGTVVVALYDPNGSTAVLEFAGLTDRIIQPAVAPRKQIEALIAELRHNPRRAATLGPAPQPAAQASPAAEAPAPVPAAPAFAPAAQVPASQPAVPAAPTAPDTRAGADAGMPDPYLRHAPANEMHVPNSDTPEYRRFAPASPARADDDRAEHERRADALRERAEAAEQHRFDADDRARAAEEHARAADERAHAAEERARVADERARAAEEHVRAADERARAADERARVAEERIGAAEEQARGAEELTCLAEARARASEERAEAAGELVDAAEARADGLSSAADAANETLARLVRACELLEREAQTRGPEMETLRAALDAERSQRTQIEAQLRDGGPSEEMLALQVRIAELERQLAEPRAAPPAPAEAARAAPAPPPEPVYAPAPVAEPQPAQAAPPPPAPVAEPQPEPVAEAYVAPSVAPTIDIVGEPGVPYVPALAPMPTNDAPVKKAPKSASAKARGLRRLISAIKRGA